MPKIEENNLRDEELRSGFNPGDADDETFSLKNAGDYPGDMPDLSVDEIEPEQFAGSETPDDIKAPDGGSVWDLFDEEPAEEVSDFTEDTVDETEMFEEAPEEEIAAEEIEEIEDEPIEEFSEEIQEDDVEGLEDLESFEVESFEDTPEEQDGSFADDFPEEEPFDSQDSEAPTEDIISEEDIYPDSFKDDEDIAAADDFEEVFPEDDAFPEEGSTEDVVAEEAFPEFDDMPDASFEENELPEDLPEDALPEADETEESFEETMATYMDENAEEDSEEFEPVEIDEDLKKLLEDEIEKTKERREKIFGPAISAQPSEDDLKPLPELAPIEQIPTKTEVVDLSDIQADRPSTYGLEQEEETLRKHSVSPSVKPEEQSKSKREKVKKEKVKKEKIKKERRKNPFFIYYAGLSAATIAFAIFGFLGYYFGLDNFFLRQVNGITGAVASLFVTEAHTALADGLEVHDNARPEEPEPISEPEPQIEEIEEPQIEEIEEPQIEKPVVKEEQRAAPKQEIVKPKPKPVKSQPAKPKQYAETRKPSESVRIKEFRESSPLSDEGIFTVQVYSTPSREDAEDWMQKLINKRVDNAFISTQRVRDIVWYRVRFGKYETRQKAQDAAMRYGFTQAWIDRVK